MHGRAGRTTTDSASSVRSCCMLGNCSTSSSSYGGGDGGARINRASGAILGSRQRASRYRHGSSNNEDNLLGNEHYEGG